MRTLNEMGSLLAARGLLAEEDRNQWKGDTHSVYWITYDSKRAVPGTLFFCKGKNFKREYLEEAIHRGCVGYVSEKEYIKKEGVPCLLTNDIRSAMAVLAASFFGYSPERLLLTGITGTKGKTTAAWYLKAMFDQWEKERGGKETGLLSSVMNYDGMRRERSTLTTPEALVLQEHLFNARTAGLSHMALEVSSRTGKGAGLRCGRIPEYIRRPHQSRRAQGF